MLYTTGNNTFPILVTDVSGGPIEGLTSDWTINGQVGDTEINSLVSVTEAIGGEGWYLAVVNLPLGQGFIDIDNSVSGRYVTGEYDIVTTVYNVDDLYAKVARDELNETQTAIGVYESQDLGTFKEGDDWDFLYVVPSSVSPDISGYSNWKASISTEDVMITAGISGYIGEFTLTPDVNSNSVRMQASHTITEGIVPEGQVETIVYSDLQAEQGGLRKTFAEFIITVRRQFTKS